MQCIHSIGGVFDWAISHEPILFKGEMSTMVSKTATTVKRFAGASLRPRNGRPDRQLSAQARAWANRGCLASVGAWRIVAPGSMAKSPRGFRAISFTGGSLRTREGRRKIFGAAMPGSLEVSTFVSGMVTGRSSIRWIIRPAQKSAVPMRYGCPVLRARRTVCRSWPRQGRRRTPDKLRAPTSLQAARGSHR